MRRLIAPAALATLLCAGPGGCGGDEKVPTAWVQVKVMTRNLFLGAELEKILRSKTADEVHGNVTNFWQTVQASDIPARARLLADEIASANPHLVGLQEVELFRTQVPSDYAASAAPESAAHLNATAVVFDFLTLLSAELEVRSAHYKIAVESPLSDTEMPGNAPGGAGGLLDIRMTDRDVILAREDVMFEAAEKHVFDNHIAGVVAPDKDGKGFPVKIVRGYEAIQATVDGAHFVFANSHLEVGGLASLYQEAQADELVSALGSRPGSVVLVGDFNSPPGGTYTKSYGYLAEKFSDAYGRLHSGNEDPAGWTCCTDIASPNFKTESRIDLVLYRGFVHALGTAITGKDPGLRTAGDLWPSDHAGVVADIEVGRFDP